MRKSSAPKPSLRTVTRADSVVPLYFQVQHLIMSRIERGEYPPATRIPSEHELGRELDVSRVTIREALRGLVRDGFLVKIQGKGTFVVEQAGREMPPLKFTGFLEDLSGRVRRLAVKLVVVDRVAVSDERRALLALPEHEHELVRIRRLRHINDSPFSYTVNYLPVAIGERIDAQALYERPLIDVLQQDLKIQIRRAHETVEAASADTEVAAQLEITPMFPVMRIQRTMFGADDRPFELVETFYRADKYKYSVDLVRVRHDGRWRWSQRTGH